MDCLHRTTSVSLLEAELYRARSSVGIFFEAETTLMEMLSNKAEVLPEVVAGNQVEKLPQVIVEGMVNDLLEGSTEGLVKEFARHHDSYASK